MGQRSMKWYTKHDLDSFDIEIVMVSSEEASLTIHVHVCLKMSAPYHTRISHCHRSLWGGVDVHKE